MERELINEESKSMPSESKESEAYLKYIYEKDEETGKKMFETIELSDGTTIDSPQFREKTRDALKRTTGSSNFNVADTIIKHLSKGMTDLNREDRIMKVNTLLPSLHPKDETEALLLGQFLALQDSGMRCMSNANNDEAMFFHIKEFFQLGVKLFRCANETLQTLQKYRSGGKQQIQIIHVSGEAKAVIANELHQGGDQ